MQGLENLNVKAKPKQADPAESPAQSANKPSVVSLPDANSDSAESSTLTFTLTQKEKYAFKAYCAERGLMMAEILRRHIQELLEG